VGQAAAVFELNYENFVVYARNDAKRFTVGAG
jgi:hypothetical protein